MSDSGPLECVVEDVIVALSEYPETSRLAIRSERHYRRRDETTLEKEDASPLERWSALADEYFQLVLVHLAFVSEVVELDRLLFEEAAAGAIRAARNLDAASTALMHGDAKTFQVSVQAVEAELASP